MLCRLTVYGGIKTGIKRLFIRVETGAFVELEPLCVLDFYVHEQYQRQGLGKQLFEVHLLHAACSCDWYLQQLTAADRITRQGVTLALPSVRAFLVFEFAGLVTPVFNKTDHHQQAHE